MVEVKNLKMSYGKKEVLKDISFSLSQGKIVGLLGSNGAGKTTIMNILTGYLKPVQGEIIIQDTDMRKNPKQAKRYIGYLPEVPPLYRDMRVQEYLFFVAGLKDIKEKKQETERVLELVHLSDRKKEDIKNLSKGMRQRVGLAQALLGNPPVIILDEPLTGLDPQESKNMRELLLDLKKEHCIIISSHILKEIEELAGEILMLKDGQLVLDDSTAAARRRGRRNVYRLTVKGDKDKIMESLENYSDLREVQYVRKKESGVYEFIAQAKNTRDIRDSIFGYLVSRKFNVYGIERYEASLEDVFIEMNGEEENQ